ncbi:hypothetical protein DYB37_005763 [Aphanomyces astaci]|uniref:SWIM-type domain-containing protein n=1 Tax=Aphanomyces astaci TaxID=112090 RepID=A0A3R7AMK3_APHAT|nr:hypothetical protein DYB35_010669 [Aphanomyces astaci]RHZ30039.1 hypothetical protein DYB37_005763 [Aphanomyces astaci]
MSKHEPADNHTNPYPHHPPAPRVHGRAAVSPLFPSPSGGLPQLPPHHQQHVPLASQQQPHRRRHDDDKTDDAMVPVAKRARQSKATNKPPGETGSNIPEKRLARYRTVASQQTQDRIARAIHQRMFLIEKQVKSPLHQTFAVLGSTGNIYTVSIEFVPACTCPDFLKGNLCKHILSVCLPLKSGFCSLSWSRFVYLKCLRVPATSPHVFQKALLTSELQEIFETASQADPTAVANARVVTHYRAALASGASADTLDLGGVQQKSLDAADCPICFEALDDGRPVVWCKEQCGNNIHSELHNQTSTSQVFPPEKVIAMADDCDEYGDDADFEHEASAVEIMLDQTVADKSVDDLPCKATSAILITESAVRQRNNSDVPTAVPRQLHDSHDIASTATCPDCDKGVVAPPLLLVVCNSYDDATIRKHCRRREDPIPTPPPCPDETAIASNVRGDNDAICIAAKIAAKRVSDWNARVKKVQMKAEADDALKRQLKREWRRSVMTEPPKNRHDRLAQTKVKMRQLQDRAKAQVTMAMDLRWYKRKASLGLTTHALDESGDVTQRAQAILTQKHRHDQSSKRSHDTTRKHVHNQLQRIAADAKASRERSCQYVHHVKGSYWLKRPLNKAREAAARKWHGQANAMQAATGLTTETVVHDSPECPDTDYINSQHAGNDVAEDVIDASDTALGTSSLEKPSPAPVDSQLEGAKSECDVTHRDLNGADFAPVLDTSAEPVREVELDPQICALTTKLRDDTISPQPSSSPAAMLDDSLKLHVVRSADVVEYVYSP